MHSIIRKGLLGTLFAGGLIALGATAANAADTSTSAQGTASGTQVVAPVSAPVNIGPTTLTVLGTSSVATNTPAPAPAPAPASNSGGTAVPSGTQAVAPISVPVNVGATSLAVLNNSGPGRASGSPVTPPVATPVTAPVTAPVTVGDTTVNLLSTTPTSGSTGTSPTTPPDSATGTGVLGTGLTAPLNLPLTVGIASVDPGLSSGVVNTPAGSTPAINAAVADPSVVAPPADAAATAGAATTVTAVVAGAGTTALASTGFNGHGVLFAAFLLLGGFIVMAGGRKIRAIKPA
ncbi:hypothetical protein [Arthrobacter sp. MA-N2]|uniref:hypothetical protein n=1 Tax=Arthrobacter sp. MA-N2 TaxID=1101188 RepID=UPI0004BA2706|nr:hypothetical protein [Arthrobacter sp. MA-N2]